MDVLRLTAPPPPKYKVEEQEARTMKNKSDMQCVKYLDINTVKGGKGAGRNPQLSIAEGRGSCLLIVEHGVFL